MFPITMEGEQTRSHDYTEALYGFLLQPELTDLLPVRDEARRELHGRLTSCLENMDTLPLNHRATQIQVH